MMHVVVNAILAQVLSWQKNTDNIVRLTDYIMKK